MKGFTMFSLIVAAFVIFCLYKVFFTGPSKSVTESETETQTPEVTEMGAIKDAVNTFKTELGPVKENVVKATNAAKSSYDQARTQANIQKLLKDENLVNLLVAAKMQEQLDAQKAEETTDA